MRTRRRTESVNPSGANGLDLSLGGDNTLLLTLTGSWRAQDRVPSSADVETRLGTEEVRKIAFNTEALGDWDSGLLTFLVKLQDICKQKGVELEVDSLPDGARRLLKLATAVPEREGARREARRVPFLVRIGKGTIAAFSGYGEMLGFIGESVSAGARLLLGRARFRRADLGLLLQDAGAQALPIVSLISFLVGVILAFLGAVQLALFGAQIFVANLVGIGMVRELGPIMAAIILAGRTGAAYAAQLGTMQVNEEIDALRTLGISPIDFLVLPRMIALVLMMPLLVLYANVLGMIGGGLIGVFMLGLSGTEYFNQTREAVSLTDIGGGLFKALVFGVLVAIAGCLRGMQCGRSASAVGVAATSAVVTGILFIILSDAVLTVIYNVLGI
ncbi:MAG: MlaE family ABC transporter permease [Alphaproteobacteria bacterium]